MDAARAGLAVALGQIVQGSRVEVHRRSGGHIGHAVVAAGALGMLHQRRGGRRTGRGDEQDGFGHDAPLLALAQDIVQFLAVRGTDVIGLATVGICFGIVAVAGGIDESVQDDVHGDAGNAQIVQVAGLEAVGEVSTQTLLAAGRYGGGGGWRGDFIGIPGVRSQSLAAAAGLDDRPSGEGPVVGKAVAGHLAVEGYVERR